MSDDPSRHQLTPEEQVRVNRAQTILWTVMAIFIILPFIVAWLTGAFD